MSHHQWEQLITHSSSLKKLTHHFTQFNQRKNVKLYTRNILSLRLHFIYPWTENVESS
jgi:hypothetical protein